MTDLARVRSDRRISVVIPTLNEAENIDPILEAVLRQGSSGDLDLEVLVVDDGSTDGTRTRVREWEARDSRVRLIPRDGERGLSGAVLAGARASHAGWVLVMDADLSHPADAIPSLAAAVVDEGHDMAIGSRYVPGGGTPGWPIKRRFLSRVAAFLGGVLVDVQDPCSGFFVVRTEAVLDAGKSARGFKIGLEILARLDSGARIKEVPITFRDRERGKSKLGAGVAWTFIVQLLSLAGVRLAGSTVVRFGISTGLGIAADAISFAGLVRSGMAPGVAHFASFGVASLLVFTLHALWTFAGSGVEGEPGRSARRLGELAVVTLLAVFLRGGLLALSQRLGALPLVLGILPAACASSAVTALGIAFIVFRRADRSGESSILWPLISAGIVLYVFALRAIYLGQVELIPQEAYYWNYSQHIDIGYLDHPPMVAWLIWIGTQVFGQSELGVRVGALVASLVALVFVFRLTKNLFGRAYAHRSAALFACLPFFFGTGFLMTPDAPLVASWAGGLYFLERVLIGGRRYAWLGAGLCVGVGLLSKYSIALVGLAALVYVLVDRPSRRWLLTPMPYLAAILALLVFSPVILWNAENDWASFFFQGPKRWSEAPRFALHILILNALGLITPLGLLGVSLGLSRPSRGRLFGLVFVLVPLSVFVFSSLRNETKLNWSGPAWIAALPFIALSFAPVAPITRGWATRWLERVWMPAIVTLLLLYGALFHHLVLGLPRAPRSVRGLEMSWKELGRQVEEIEEEVIARTGSQPLVVGMDKYYLASLLAFYDPKGDGAQETTSKNLFGRRGLMYDLWFPSESQKGRTLVLVSDTERSLESPSILSRVKASEPIRDLSVRNHGEIVGKYFTRVVHGYSGQGIVLEDVEE